jgi:hypothetical protein
MQPDSYSRVVRALVAAEPPEPVDGVGHRPGNILDIGLSGGL